MKNDKKLITNKTYTEITVISEAIEETLKINVTNSRRRRRIDYNKKIMNDPFIMNC